MSVPILAAAGTTAAASETVEPATAACFEFGAGSWQPTVPFQTAWD